MLTFLLPGLRVKWKERRLILNSSSNGGTVCNIAAYPMYLQTDALSGNDDYPSDLVMMNVKPVSN